MKKITTNAHEKTRKENKESPTTLKRVLTGRQENRKRCKSRSVHVYDNAPKS